MSLLVQTTGPGRCRSERGGEANLRRPEEDEGVGDDASRRPAPRGPAERTRATRRISWARRRGEGKAVVAVAHGGALRCARYRGGERGRGWGGARGRIERDQGARWSSLGWTAPRRERRQQAAGWRACTLAVLPFAAASSRGRRVATASRAGPLLGRGGAPGKSGKSFSCFLFLFLTFVLYPKEMLKHFHKC